MTATIAEMVARLHRSHEIHGTDIRCPTCGAGIRKWCIGTERLAGPTDLNPSHPARLASSPEARGIVR